MGDGGVGGSGGESGTDADFAGISAEIGLDYGGDLGPSDSASMNLDIAKASVEAMNAQEGGMNHPAMFGENMNQSISEKMGDKGEGPAAKVATPEPETPAPAPAPNAEKKEGTKRKARNRSLLNDEEKTVYRRSILGS